MDYKEEYSRRLKDFDKYKHQSFTEFHHDVVLDLFRESRLDRQIGAVLGASYLAMLELGYKLVKEDE